MRNDQRAGDQRRLAGGARVGQIEVAAQVGVAVRGFHQAHELGLGSGAGVERLQLDRQCLACDKSLRGHQRRRVSALSPAAAGGT